jgi:hypothetical protein
MWFSTVELIDRLLIEVLITKLMFCSVYSRLLDNLSFNFRLEIGLKLALCKMREELERTVNNS